MILIIISSSAKTIIIVLNTHKFKLPWGWLNIMKWQMFPLCVTGKI